MDPQSFFIAVALAYGVLAMLLVIADRPRLASPSGLLAVSFAAIAVGVLLQGLNEHLPYAATTILGNLLAWLGLLYQGWAIRGLSGRSDTRRIRLTSIGAVLLVVAVLLSLGPVARFTVGNLLYAGLFVFSAWCLLRWTSASASLRAATAVLFGATAVVYALRAVVVAVGLEPPTFIRTEPPVWATAVMYPLTFTALVGGAFCLLLLIKRSLEDQLRETSEQLAQVAAYDDLTGLPNRRTLLERAQVEMSRAERTGRPLSIGVFDLDRLKLINDGHGHQAGDEALRRVAAACRTSFRDLDTAARIGGDEFAVLLPDSDLAQAQAAMARMLLALRKAPLEKGDFRIEVSASAGVAEYHAGEPLDQVFARADRALYASKGAGGGAAMPGTTMPLAEEPREPLA